MSGNIFFISDPHFHHANLVQGGKIGIRGMFATVQEMNQHIIEGINNRVSDRDKLYVLGDITLSRGHSTVPLEIVRQLKGHKRLVLGNHDHYGFADYRAVGFEKIMAVREMAGVVFTHIPVHPSQFYRFKGNVHGHVHTRTVMRSGADLPLVAADYPDPRYINACVEALNYRPIELNEILDHFGRLEP